MSFLQRLWRYWLRKLPRNAEPICVEWPIKEGGVCAYAWTDDEGEAFISVKTLNRIGKPTGSPDWLRSDSFASDMIMGFIDSRPLVMHVRIKVTIDGLELIVRPPSDVKSASDFKERQFTPWDSEPPTFSMTLSPSFQPYATHSFPAL